jgi:hypothetical protein
LHHYAQACALLGDGRGGAGVRVKSATLHPASSLGRKPVLGLVALLAFLALIEFKFGHDRAIRSFGGNASGNKWVVVTSIQAPTSDVTRMCAESKVNGFGMVVVADSLTPTDWNAHGCVFLSIEMQTAMDLETSKILPYKSYARKNLGYLYAISKGATHIYESDDDNYSDLARVFADIDDQQCAAKLKDDGVHDAQNVYAYFGRPDVWPRGFPLENINNTNGNNVLSDELERSFSPVKSYLVNGDPDTDAIFRLTHGEAIGDVQLKTGIPPVSLERNVMCPFNSQAVLWSKAAFLLMLMPATPPKRVCDIWRGYFSQRLLWEMGAGIMFGEKGVLQIRTAHSFLDDFTDETELYRDSRKLMDTLMAWKPRGATMDTRFLELCALMSKGGFWNEMQYCEAWVADLKKIGYSFPAVEKLSGGLGASAGNVCRGESAQLGLKAWVNARDATLVMTGRAAVGSRRSINIESAARFSRLGSTASTAENVEKAPLGDDAIPKKRFAWLMQSTNITTDADSWKTDDRDIFLLTFKEQPDPNDLFKIFDPGSTWSTGRNGMLDAAVEYASKMSDGGYDYYVFMDDDIPSMAPGGLSQATTMFDGIEAFLINNQPAVGWFPNAKPWTADMEFPLGPDDLIYGPADPDPNVQAFHTSTLGLLLPYDNHFDATCIYASNQILRQIGAATYAHGWMGSRNLEFNISGEHTHTSTEEDHAGEKTYYDAGCNFDPVAVDAGTLEYLADVFTSTEIKAAFNASYSFNSYTFLRPAPESFSSCVGLPSRDLAARVDRDWIAAHIDMDSEFGKQRVTFMDKHPELFEQTSGFVIDRLDCATYTKEEEQDTSD